jgi:WD40 repeat protein
LKRLDLDGGAPQVLANVIIPAGGAWSRSGTIVYTPLNAGIFYRVAANGGGSATPVEVAAPGPRWNQRFPIFLPDGHRVLFYSAAVDGPGGIFVDDLDHPAPRKIVDADGSAVYVDGRLLFPRQGALLSQIFDPATAETSGSAVRVADDVAVLPIGQTAVSAANTRVIAFRRGSARAARRLLWFDRRGRELGRVGDDSMSPLNPALSRDGRYLAFQALMQGNTDIWVVDLQRNIPTRFTLDPEIDALPVWSPDGSRIFFSSSRGGASALYVQALNSSTPEMLVPPETTNIVKGATDWSPDGRWLLFRRLDTIGNYDLYSVRLEPPRTPTAVVRSPYDERDGQFSPDGKWIAYQSDESGRPEIYIQPFGEPGMKVRVSSDAGTQVRWRQDGKELFYVNGNNQLVAVPVDLDAANGPAFAAPSALFATHVVGVVGVQRQQYVVAPDGQRFLVNTISEDASGTPITLMLNWRPPAR